MVNFSENLLGKSICEGGVFEADCEDETRVFAQKNASEGDILLLARSVAAA